MSWLLIVGLKNAILVAPLAVLALGIGRYTKRPALDHVLWLIVLVKLLTPPLVDVPILPDGWHIDVESLVATTSQSQPMAAVEPTDLQPYGCPTPAEAAASDAGPNLPSTRPPALDAACDPAP